MGSEDATPPNPRFFRPAGWPGPHRGMARGAPWDGPGTPWDGPGTPWDGPGGTVGWPGHTVEWLSHTVGWLRMADGMAQPHRGMAQKDRPRAIPAGIAKPPVPYSAVHSRSTHRRLLAPLSKEQEAATAAGESTASPAPRQDQVLCLSGGVQPREVIPCWHVMSCVCVCARARACVCVCVRAHSALLERCFNTSHLSCATCTVRPHPSIHNYACTLSILATVIHT